MAPAAVTEVDPKKPPQPLILLAVACILLGIAGAAVNFSQYASLQTAYLRSIPPPPPPPFVMPARVAYTGDVIGEDGLPNDFRQAALQAIGARLKLPEDHAVMLEWFLADAGALAFPKFRAEAMEGSITDAGTLEPEAFPSQSSVPDGRAVFPLKDGPFGTYFVQTLAGRIVVRNAEVTFTSNDGATTRLHGTNLTRADNTRSATSRVLKAEIEAIHKMAEERNVPFTSYQAGTFLRRLREWQPPENPGAPGWGPHNNLLNHYILADGLSYEKDGRNALIDSAGYEHPDQDLAAWNIKQPFPFQPALLGSLAAIAMLPKEAVMHGVVGVLSAVAGALLLLRVPQSARVLAICLWLRLAAAALSITLLIWYLASLPPALRQPQKLGGVFIQSLIAAATYVAISIALLKSLKNPPVQAYFRIRNEPGGLLSQRASRRWLSFRSRGTTRGMLAGVAIFGLLATGLHAQASDGFSVDSDGTGLNHLLWFIVSLFVTVLAAWQLASSFLHDQSAKDDSESGPGAPTGRRGPTTRPAAAGTLAVLTVLASPLGTWAAVRPATLPSTRPATARPVKPQTRPAKPLLVPPAAKQNASSKKPAASPKAPTQPGATGDSAADPGGTPVPAPTGESDEASSPRALAELNRLTTALPFAEERTAVLNLKAAFETEPGAVRLTLVRLGDPTYLHRDDVAAVLKEHYEKRPLEDENFVVARRVAHDSLKSPKRPPETLIRLAATRSDALAELVSDLRAAKYREVEIGKLLERSDTSRAAEILRPTLATSANDLTDSLRALAQLGEGGKQILRGVAAGTDPVIATNVADNATASQRNLAATAQEQAIFLLDHRNSTSAPNLKDLEAVVRGTASPSRQVRQTAADVCTNFREPGIAALLKLLSDQAQPEHLTEIWKTLASRTDWASDFGDPNDFPPARRKAAATVFAAAIRRPEEGNLSAVEGRLRSLLQSADPAIRREAQFVYCRQRQLADKMPEAELIGLVNDADPIVRDAAASVADRRHIQLSAQQLKQLVLKSRNVGGTAKTSLERGDIPGSAEALVELMDAPDKDIAERARATVGSRQIGPALFKRTHDTAHVALFETSPDPLEWPALSGGQSPSRPPPTPTAVIDAPVGSSPANPLATALTLVALLGLPCLVAYAAFAEPTEPASTS